MPARRRHALPAALLLGCGLAGAALVAPRWDAAGAFAHETSLAPGAFVEVCERVERGARVGWSFEAAMPLDFNIHHHEGKDVRYAEKVEAARAEGTLRAATRQDYCWMWSNKGGRDVALRLRLVKG